VLDEDLALEVGDRDVVAVGDDQYVFVAPASRDLVRDPVQGQRS